MKAPLAWEGDDGRLARGASTRATLLESAVARATVLRRMGKRQYSAKEAAAIAERVADLGCRSLGVAPAVTRS
jgi:hypothetical protein